MAIASAVLRKILTPRLGIFFGFSLLVVLVVGLFAMAWPAAASERDYLTLGAGAFDALDRDRLSVAFSAEYRFGRRLLEGWGGSWFRGLGPLVGLNVNTEGGLFGFADFFLDLRPTTRLVIWPSAGLGGYRKGNSRDLGGKRQFHLEMLFGFLAERHLLGISFQHISNADTQRTNPGTNFLLLTYNLSWEPLF